MCSSLDMGSDEESRQRQYHVRRESLLTQVGDECRIYPYPFVPVEYRNLSEILVTNWGRANSKTGEGTRFRPCPDCGGHQPNDPLNPTQARAVQKWQQNHACICAGEPVSLVLAYRFSIDCLVLNLPSWQDATPRLTPPGTAVGPQDVWLVRFKCASYSAAA